MKVSVATFLAIIFVSPIAHAGFYSGSELFASMEKENQGSSSYTAGAGTGYVMGVYDVLDQLVVCAPDGVTVRQVKQVVFNYMQEHPESWNSSAHRSVAAALTQVWPCKKQ